MTARALRLTGAGLREAGTNLSLAALYLLFAWAHGHRFVQHPRPSLALVVVMEGVVAVLLLVRSRAAQASFSPWSWLTTVVGSFAPLLLRPGAEAQDSPAGQAIQVLGALLAIASILSLQRSFGLLPAVRTLRMGGAYRWVRHPIYAAYTVQNLGYLLSNRTLANLAVVAVALLFQVLRVYNEERLLRTLPAYEEYARRTRWRLLPLVF
ncbi:MAG TPA: methyltransferase [Anaeromyxobacteraceae bacterium]|nr:methyltransferase [Anaeromyxobacteraceae bacterium]